jgi:RNA recognition motif-containing protein
MTIRISNLDPGVSNDELKKVFKGYGEVSSVEIATDRLTNQSKGFGFVVMPLEQEATKAIDALNGFSMGGRSLVVQKAKPRTMF